MKTIQQLSIFLENKSGRLYEIMEIIGKAQIRILAATVADTSEYGILRLITTDNAKALSLLKEHNIPTAVSEVVAFATDSEAGSFYRKLKNLSEAQVSIEYMYCFSIKEKAFIILKVSDITKALNTLSENGFEAYSTETLTTL